MALAPLPLEGRGWGRGQPAQASFVAAGPTHRLGAVSTARVTTTPQPESVSRASHGEAQPQRDRASISHILRWIGPETLQRRFGASYPCAPTSYMASDGGAEKNGATLPTSSR